MRASERARFKEAIPTAYLSYVEGLMMQEMVRYHARIKKISRLLATQSAYLFEILRCKIVLKIHGKLINQDSACCADDQDP